MSCVPITMDIALMPTTVFFSWQSDTPVVDGRNFIERALEKALKNISGEIGLEESDRPQLDRDTKNVPGSPRIFDTILKKIDKASVFVPDITFVASRAKDGQMIPNPNVMIEYGYARKCKDLVQFLPVMNIA